MAKPAVRITVIQFCFALGIAAVLARAAQLQVVEGAEWAGKAAKQRTVHDTLAARRGAIYDRSGVAFATTQEFYHVGIAPNEVLDTAAVLRLVPRSLGVPAARLAQSFRTKKYLYFHGPFTATQVQALRRLKGVHPTGEFQRNYPSRDLARPVIGRLEPDGGRGGSGIELELDSILTGKPGEAVFLKDRAGRRYESPSRLISEPVAGQDVYLTIDAQLQEIAERALDDALDSLKAEGGDVVFLDPKTGELLALASRQPSSADGASSRASVFTDPYQPGSTAKLFTAAALLVHGRVDSSDAVSGENGTWAMPVRRGRPFVIHDSHKEAGLLTLAQAIEVSSNIAMAKFSQRLTAEEHFGMLRAFGFGSPTGVEFPSEARGQLQRPDAWLPDFSRASHAMGYEFGVTPVQLAAAYAAIANGGVLLTPTLVREVRGPDGGLVYRHRPEPVRRVIPEAIAARLREYLRGAVSEAGTGGRAQLAGYELVGKTGTARRVENGRYAPGEYVSSFAALFPAKDPQLIVIVKIDNPRAGSYYGGSTAAPVTRSMLEQALAAQRIAIDRTRLAPRDSEPVVAAAAPRIATPGRPAIVVSWPYRNAPENPAEPLPVPSVVGTPVRAGVLALHRRGFRVQLKGGAGRIVRTAPAAGDSAQVGSTVAVWSEP
jgi:cell division protein FtsI (penicillin-binding protein 3)